MKRPFLYFLLSLTVLTSCKNKDAAQEKLATAQTNIEENSEVNITPISHATAVIEFNDQTIFIDPTGNSAAFQDFNRPNYVIITDVHGDHMSINTLNDLDLSNTIIVAPKTVADNLKAINAKSIEIMNNGETKNFSSFSVEAIPMYNLREEALQFHPKGRGNGYVLTIGKKRIYFSGDTEDIPEMRALQNIDKAYVCMNLPYTMTVESAADAVLAFQPKRVYPYHYRGTGGLSDVAKFKKLVTQQNKNIEVVQLNWYPKN